MTYMAKIRYLALMIRRIIDAIDDPSKLDDKDYFTIESIDGNGNLILTKHHPIYGESDGYATTIKNLIKFINDGSWVWV